MKPNQILCAVLPPLCGTHCARCSATGNSQGNKEHIIHQWPIRTHQAHALLIQDIVREHVLLLSEGLFASFTQPRRAAIEGGVCAGAV